MKHPISITEVDLSGPATSVPSERLQYCWGRSHTHTWLSPSNSERLFSWKETLISCERLAIILLCRKCVVRPKTVNYILCSHHSLCSKQAYYPCSLSKCSITFISVGPSQTYFYCIYFLKKETLQKVSYFFCQWKCNKMSKTTLMLMLLTSLMCLVLME